MVTVTAIDREATIWVQTMVLEEHLLLAFDRAPGRVIFREEDDEARNREI